MFSLGQPQRYSDVKLTMNADSEMQSSMDGNSRPAVKGHKCKIHVTIKPDRVISHIQQLYSPELLAYQSQQIEGSDGARMSTLCADHMLTTTYYDGVETIYDAFQRGLKVAGDKPCLGWKQGPGRPFEWMTYNEVNERATFFGAGLINIGLFQNNDTRVGIYSQNRPEYMIADQALYHHSLTGVPLYDTLGEDACICIINQADLAVIICDSNAKVTKLLTAHKQIPVLHTLVTFEVANSENQALARNMGVNIVHFTEIERLGQENPVIEKPPASNDISMICYTSGTTGAPKGAMLTHGNIMACVSGGLKVMLASGIPFNSDDCLISYLPLAHSYERVMEAAALMNGAQIGYFSGDVKKLMDDIKDLKPTIFPTVPRLLNRFYDKIMAGLSASWTKKFLFHKAINNKSHELKRGIIRNNSVWDKVVFRSVQMTLGGRVRVITTGSAPISDNVLSVLRCIVGCPMLEGYGQTECSGVCTLTLVGDSEPGHVGPPLSCNIIKLIDVPEMNYFSKENRGEICVCGPNVFVGYLKDEEKTKETLDEAGWLRTGDIGQWMPNGTLKIIDRKKYIFKLAQGEYIAPEKIENILVQSPWVTQVFIYGDSLQSFILAIVVPDADTMPGLAAKQGIHGTFQELVDNPEVKQCILTSLTDIGKSNGLTSLEQVQDIKLHPELFSVENGLMTPTFKFKRHEICRMFAKDFERMYATPHSERKDKPRSAGSHDRPRSIGKLGADFI